MDDDELALRHPEPDGPRKRTRVRRNLQAPQDKLESSSAVVRVEGAFQLAFRKEWGFPVIMNYARDRKILNDMIEQIGEELVLSLIPEFMQATRPVTQGGDPVVSKSRYANIMDFKFHAQYLLMRRTRGPQLQQRTADNVHEVAKAMGHGRINGEEQK